MAVSGGQTACLGWIRKVNSGLPQGSVQGCTEPGRATPHGTCGRGTHRLALCSARRQSRHMRTVILYSQVEKEASPAKSGQAVVSLEEGFLGQILSGVRATGRPQADAVVHALLPRHQFAEGVPPARASTAPMDRRSSGSLPPPLSPCLDDGSGCSHCNGIKYFAPCILLPTVIYC